MKLGVVLSHPTQYYSPWFRWLATDAKFDVRVFYLWDFGVTKQRDPRFETTFRWDVDLLSGYEHEFVPNVARHPGTERFWGLWNPALASRLTAWNPSALLLFGYSSRSHLRAIAWARTRRVPLLFRGDSHFLGRGAPSGFRRRLLRALYSQFDAVLRVGAANGDYFRALGVPADRSFFAPHSVNAQLFDPSPAQLAGAKALREKIGIHPETRVVLFAGKLVSAKQPLALLEAFLGIAGKNHALVFVGDGPEKSALIRLTENACARNVHFLPFANQTEMPARYLLADVFALPSRGHYETWGLAVNEAMHMGVPALVSDLVGCQRDLVHDGETGWVFSVGQSNGLHDALQRSLQDVAAPENRRRLATSVKARIAEYTYAQTTRGLVDALRALGLTPT